MSIYPIKVIATLTTKYWILVSWDSLVGQQNNKLNIVILFTSAGEPKVLLVVTNSYSLFQHKY